MFICQLRAPQKRPYPQQQFLHINGLDHIIIRAGLKTCALIGQGLSCRNDQHRNGDVGMTQLAGQLITIHFRHHHIHHQQMDGVLGQRLQRSLPVFGLENSIARASQVNAHQLAQLQVVLYHQNICH